MNHAPLHVNNSKKNSIPLTPFKLSQNYLFDIIHNFPPNSVSLSLKKVPIKSKSNFSVQSA